MKPLIITHKNCVDGCCCKSILHKKFGNDAVYMEIDHANLDINSDINALDNIAKIMNFNNSEIYISDFCLNSDFIEKLLMQGNKITIMDHHESSINFIEPFEKRILNGENLNISINFSKDNSESGALLTWKTIFPELTIPKVVKYVSDGDIWAFEFGENTKYFYSGILHLFGEAKNIPQSAWDHMINSEDYVNSIISQGEVYYKQYMEEVMSFVPKAIKIKLFGFVGYMVESPKIYTSDLGNQLALKSGNFGLIYRVDEEGMYRCSLRSVGDCSVKDIALKFGGGGHFHASAFRCKNLEEFNSIVFSEKLTTVSIQP